MRENTASDCIHCHSCQNSCDFLSKYRLDIGDVEALSELAYRCFLCGKCTEVCPLGIDGRASMLKLRQEAVREARVDLESSYSHTLNEKKDYIFRNWRHASSGCVFFPGCNFPSLFPKNTSQLSKLFAEQGIGTVYDCCGKPIAELGMEDNEAIIVDRLKQGIADYGIEEIIVACPNCGAFLSERLEVKITNVYSKLAELGMGHKLEGDFKFFVPCPDREQKNWLEAIKPFINGEISFVSDVQCCGLGANAKQLEPELSVGFAKQLKAKHDEQIYTYCASCTGSLKRNGFASINHILSLILETNEQPDTKKSYVNRMLTKVK